MKKSIKTNQSQHNDKTSFKKSQSPIARVRIIGGQFKRRQLDFIDADGLRPTPDRLRETLFNWLLGDIHGARVLDSCAGSGVLGFEALSRGAAHCSFIEANPTQAQQLMITAKELNIDPTSYQVLSGKAEHLLAHSEAFRQPFDLVFIDPPYAMALWQAILQALITNRLINEDTLIYLEADYDLELELTQLVATLPSHSLDKADTNTELTSFLQSITGFNRLKQTKVGQVVAGLYQLSSS